MRERGNEGERREKARQLAPATICYFSSPWHQEQPFSGKECASLAARTAPKTRPASRSLRASPSCRAQFASGPTAASSRRCSPSQNVSVWPDRRRFFLLHTLGRITVTVVSAQQHREQMWPRRASVKVLTSVQQLSEHSCSHICRAQHACTKLEMISTEVLLCSGPSNEPNFLFHFLR